MDQLIPGRVLRPEEIFPVAPTRVPLSRTFAVPRTVPGKTIDPVDALSICQDVLTELKPFERAAIVAFLSGMVSA